MLVFIRKLSLSTLIWVPICQGFSHFSGFLHHFVLAKVATSSIRVNKFSLRRVISICFAAVKRSCVIFLAFVVIVHGHVCCGCAAGERCCCCCLRRHYKLLHSGGIELNTHTHPYYQAAIFTHTHPPVARHSVGGFRLYVSCMLSLSY